MNESDDIVLWEDVEGAAERMFKVWAFGGELKWVTECWEHFRKDGLTSSADLIEETKTYLRLIALARIYEEFSGIMWDEDPQTPISYLSENLEIDPIAIGIIARSHSEFDATGIINADCLMEYSIASASDQLRSEIHSCLIDAYDGDTALYSRMAQTIKEPDSDEEEGDDLDVGEEFSPTPRHGAAWSYVCNGFQKT